jgi:alanine racemase
MIEVPYKHPAWIEIDLEQFKKNLQILKAYTGATVKLCVPVKANAYGHGLVPISKAAVVAGADYLGVSCLQEGIILRKAGITIPILVLGAIHSEQISDFITHDLEFTVASLFKAKLVAQECKMLNKSVKVHLEIDTGMNRTGMRVETARAALDFVRSESVFELKGVYSHLATADEPDNPFVMRQLELFINFLQENGLRDDPNVIAHIANSAGVAVTKAAHLDMIRPGILAYGYHPLPNMPTELQEIKSCFAVKAKVAYFKKVIAGHGISYNHTYKASRDAHIITIPVGYGDGLRRSLSNKGAILLNGKRYPIVGNVCMDQFMVDVGDDSAYVGDMVTIIGKNQDQNIPIEEHSNICSTITYEILCGFNNRLPRLYLNHTGAQWE